MGHPGWRPLWALVILAVCMAPTDTKVNQEQVDLWANKIGDQLWNLGVSVTRSQDIKKKYKDLGAKVNEKNGTELLDQIMEDLNQMLERKMDAVKCITEKAESISLAFQYDRCENFTYHSAKKSNVTKISTEGDEEEEEGETMYYDDEEEEEEEENEFDEREKELIERIKDPVALEKALKDNEEKRLKDEERQAKEEEDEELALIEECKAALDDECDKTKCAIPEYLQMDLQKDRHFDNIPVNTSYSSVQVPTNIFDQTSDVQEGLQWSESLDEVFRQNYASDPSLTWQYFGHSTGFLRLFPAIQWRTEADMYDCRSRVWYIEAATCTKDVVILVDNSGSMTGMGWTLAKLVVDTILDTLSSNDFVNVYRFNMTVRDIVPCFNTSYETGSNETGAQLVQATVENKKAFSEGMKTVQMYDNSNHTKALLFAFELLEKERETCVDTHCNQAIMLVTDGVQTNLTEIFEKFNRQNGTAPVRIFTYLLGKEVAKMKEAQLVSCTNRGWFSHINSIMDIREEVYKYIPVIARPLVLQQKHHPVVWTPLFLNVEDMKMRSWLRLAMNFQEQSERLKKYTLRKSTQYSRHREDKLYIREVAFRINEYAPSPHETRVNSFALAYRMLTRISGSKGCICYADRLENLKVSGLHAKKNNDTNDDSQRYTEYRLMTAVSVPAFDYKINLQNDTRTARLLGVAGLDVPLEDFRDLTRPHNIGVNGYAFIITNNGFILMHPDLRPVFDGKLRDNYHSIDLTEVEFEDEERPPRDPSPKIIELREAMVNHSRAKMHIRMKYHFDDMRRAASEEKDIYIVPLTGTGFSLALVLPSGYGHTNVRVGDQIKKTRQRGTPATDHLKDDDKWRVHPEWEYCAHFHPNMGKFATVEDRLMFFLARNATREFQFGDRWKKEGNDYCSRKTIPEDDYYCDSGLVQMLVFDARLTDSYRGEWSPKTRLEEELVDQFRVTQRFIATQGGLTRWQHISKDINVEASTQWGDSNKKTIDEPWYVGAVLQHQAEAESFFFSVAPDAATKDYEQVDVVATVVIPYQDGEKVALGAVAGYHLPILNLFEHFKNITFKIPSQCPSCNTTCADDHLDCFLIDSSGYIVVSKSPGHVGQLFGEVEGGVFAQMLAEKLFVQRTIYDYQALCPNETFLSSSANYLFNTPLLHARWMVDWLLGRLSWLLLQTRIGRVLAANLFIDAAGASPFFEHDDNDDGYFDYNFFQDYSQPKRRIKRKKPPKPEDEGGEVFPRKPKENETRTDWLPCDRKITLYGLTHHGLPDTDSMTEDEGEEEDPTKECSIIRPSHVGRIPHSNLLLVVVDTGYPSCYKKFSTKPEELNREDPKKDMYHCHKLGLGNLTRRRMAGCFSHHPEEREILSCGRGPRTSANKKAIFITLLTVVFARFCV